MSRLINCGFFWLFAMMFIVSIFIPFMMDCNWDAIGNENYQFQNRVEIEVTDRETNEVLTKTYQEGYNYLAATEETAFSFGQEFSDAAAEANELAEDVKDAAAEAAEDTKDAASDLKDTLDPDADTGADGGETGGEDQATDASQTAGDDGESPGSEEVGKDPEAGELMEQDEEPTKEYKYDYEDNDKAVDLNGDERKDLITNWDYIFGVDGESPIKPEDLGTEGSPLDVNVDGHFDGSMEFLKHKLQNDGTPATVTIDGLHEFQDVSQFKVDADGNLVDYNGNPVEPLEIAFDDDFGHMAQRNYLDAEGNLVTVKEVTAQAQQDDAEFAKIVTGVAMGVTGLAAAGAGACALNDSRRRLVTLEGMLRKIHA